MSAHNHAALTLQSRQSYRAKVYYALVTNVEHFIPAIGLQRAGFLTLTFPFSLASKREAERRFRSFASNFLRSHFGAWVKVAGLHKRGGIHLHLVVDCLTDIGSGFNHASRRGGGPENANSELRRLRRLLRSSLARYGFGRQWSLTPVESASKVALYLGEQLGDVHRNPAARNFRVVSYSGDFPRVCSHKFSWARSEWRKLLAIVAPAFGCPDYGQLKHLLGRKWGYTLNVALRTDPSLRTFILNHAAASQEDLDSLRALLCTRFGFHGAVYDEEVAYAL
jgi:hypothetical protein